MRIRKHTGDTRRYGFMFSRQMRWLSIEAGLHTWAVSW